jgi:hypothetical protein
MTDEEPLDEETEDEPPQSGPNLTAAMACYGGIAVLAWFTLDGKFLGVVWIFLGGLAVKTYLAKLQKP